MAKVKTGTLTEKHGITVIPATRPGFAFHPVGEVGDGGVWSNTRRIGHIYAEEQTGGHLYDALDTQLRSIGKFPSQAKAIDCVVEHALRQEAAR
jgi:hypothetical protein